MIFKKTGNSNYSVKTCSRIYDTVKMKYRIADKLLFF